MSVLVPRVHILPEAQQRLWAEFRTSLSPDFAPLVTFKALSYFDDGDLGELPGEVSSRLAAAASHVRVVDPVALRSTSTAPTAIKIGRCARH